MTALPDFDPVIHAAARLKVMVTLAALGPGDRISFSRAQKLLAMTAGNFSVHLRRLEEAGYVTIAKTFDGRIPTTFLSLTESGRGALEDYTQTLQRLLASANDRSSTVSSSGPFEGS